MTAASRSLPNLPNLLNIGSFHSFAEQCFARSLLVPGSEIAIKIDAWRNRPVQHKGAITMPPVDPQGLRAAGTQTYTLSMS